MQNEAVNQVQNQQPYSNSHHTFALSAYPYNQHISLYVFHQNSNMLYSSLFSCDNLPTNLQQQIKSLNEICQFLQPTDLKIENGILLLGIYDDGGQGNHFKQIQIPLIKLNQLPPNLYKMYIQPLNFKLKTLSDDLKQINTQKDKLTKDLYAKNKEVQWLEYQQEKFKQQSSQMIQQLKAIIKENEREYVNLKQESSKLIQQLKTIINENEREYVSLKQESSQMVQQFKRKIKQKKREYAESHKLQLQRQNQQRQYQNQRYKYLLSRYNQINNKLNVLRTRYSQSEHQQSQNINMRDGNSYLISQQIHSSQINNQMRINIVQPPVLLPINHNHQQRINQIYNPLAIIQQGQQEDSSRRNRNHNHNARISNQYFLNEIIQNQLQCKNNRKNNQPAQNIQMRFNLDELSQQIKQNYQINHVISNPNQQVIIIYGSNPIRPRAIQSFRVFVQQKGEKTKIIFGISKSTIESNQYSRIFVNQEQSVSVMGVRRSMRQRRIHDRYQLKMNINFNLNQLQFKINQTILQTLTLPQQLQRKELYYYLKIFGGKATIKLR